MDKLTDTYTLRGGVQIPCVGFGTWQVPDGETTVRSVVQAVEAGYRHIDTAAIYGNEAGVGEAIRACGVAREELFITTKLWNTDRGYERTLAAFDLSLKKLGLDYLDLFLIHWPANRPRDGDDRRAVQPGIVARHGKAVQGRAGARDRPEQFPAPPYRAHSCLR